MAATLVLDIVTNATKAIAGMHQIEGAAGKAGSAVESHGKKFGSFAKTAGKVAGGAALGGVVAVFKTGVGEQKDFLSGQAQLANGIKTTGNAAGVSVGGMEDLASSVQNYSGQTDDSVVASEKLLLTFTNVHNSAGKGNDIFNQATKSTADMAAKMGGPASKYAIQLGKALNDPVKGISSLTRVGVSFSDGQKKQIKSLVAAGDTMGAQKIIMGELNKEFGGSAKAAGETLPGQMERAKRSFEDVSQGVVAGLMPVLTTLAGFLQRDVMPAFKTVMGFISANKTVFGIVAGAILAIVAAIKIWTGVQAAWNFVMDANPILLIILAIIALGAALVIAYKKSATFRGIVQTAFKVIGDVAKVMWGVLKTVFTAIWGVLKFVGTLWFALFVKPCIIAFNILKGVITAAVGWISAAFTAVIGFFKNLPGRIASALSTLFAVITYPYRLAWSWIVNTMIPAVIGVFRNIAGWITSALSTVFAVITAPFRAAWDWVANSLVPGVINWIRSIPGKVTSALSTVAEAIKAPFRAAWDWVANSLVPGIINWIRSIPGKVAAALATLAEIIKAPFSAAWGWVKTNVIDKLSRAFSGLWSAIKTAMGKVEGAITAPFSAAWTWIKKNVIDKITSGFSAVGSALKAPINAVIRAWNGLHFTIGGFRLPFPPHTKFPSVTISTPDLPLLAAGGYVTRATAAVIGERGAEVVAPEPMLRRLIREELGRAGPRIVVNGALDPDAVARQIESLLARRDRRVNGVTRRGAPVSA